MHFTERIQNTLLKPEILKLCKNQKIGSKGKKEQQQFQDKINKEKAMSHGELMKVRQEEHEKRKRDRVDLLHAT